MSIESKLEKLPGNIDPVYTIRDDSHKLLGTYTNRKEVIDHLN